MTERARAHVLIVDDSRLERELAREALDESCEITCAASGEEALEALRRGAVDLILSDLTMPGLSGLELLARAQREHPGIDFVLLTGNASVESAVEALRMGAADYLRKPIQGEELAYVVERTLARRRLREENVRLRDELAALEACRALAPCLESGEVYAVSLDVLLRTLSRGRGFAIFRRTSVSMSDGAAFRGFAESEAAALRQILAVDKPVDLDGFSRVEVVDQGTVHEALREAGVAPGRLLVVPIHGREAEAGAIWVLEDERRFEEAEIARARLVAGHAELALHNAERYNRAKERAFLDDVTEIYNARYLLAATDHEIRRAERYGSELSVLFLDLDRFKLVNDRHGHLVGSRTLRQLAQVLASCVRQVDTLARYGGDEFTIVLVDTPLEPALQVAERIRRTVEETAFDGGRGGALRLTISVGVASYPIHGRTREELLDQSDKAMYRAKSLGRNRVCSATDLG
jgi:two-component system cell cycle response regulator